MFGFFKNKKKELAKQIYGVFKPRIHLAQTKGVWKNHLSFGDAFIDDDYLFAFFNMYINTQMKANGIEGIEQGKMAVIIYELMDPTYKDFIKIQRLMDRYHLLSQEGNKVFKQGTNDAFMMYNVLTDHPVTSEFKSNPIYKEAVKYFESGGAKKDHDFATKVMPKDLYDADFMSNVPASFLKGNRIFEQTFVKRLNSVFKVKY